MIYAEKDHAQGRNKRFLVNYFSKDHSDMSPKLRMFTELLDNEDKEVDAAREILDRAGNIDSLKSLEDFLFSTRNNPPILGQVHQPMNAPLSHYFIHTSLKSYFTGNLLIERYSSLPIIDALKQGVRVVELDLFPYGKDDICVRQKPLWFLEKPLALKECLDAIKEHAFTPTRSYPLIITFKDGLKPDLQSKATQMIDQTFAGMVYHHDLQSSDDVTSPEEKENKILSPSPEEKEKNKLFPSPEELKNKILISRRPPNTVLYANADKNKVETRNESTEESYQTLVSFHAVEPRGILLKALTDKAKNIQRPGWYEKEVISFTQNQFLRTRPKRKLLSNAPYKPQRAWMHGAQMIALCRQDDREKLWLMQGMFRANGGCGYVKKPDFLLNASPSGVFYPTENPVVEKTLQVKVYMGDGWREDFRKRIGRLSKPDLYVKISIAGVPHDENNNKQTTIKNNDWTPTWGDEFTFPLTYPDLALLSIEVYDHEISTADGFGGQTCLPVCELIEGIRAVPLYDEKGEACRSTMLLMRFKWS